MAITIKNGNILHANEHIIAHQVNALGIMGGGVARQIKKAYPGVFRRYQIFVNNHDSSEFLLGVNLMVVSNGQPAYEYDPKSDTKLISNLFGQLRIGTSQKQTDEKALRTAMEHLVEFSKQRNLTIAMPYGIGCGLGGGDWNEIKAIIEDVFGDYPVTLYRYTK